MKTLFLALTLVSLHAHAELTAAGIKACFSNTKTKFLSIPGKNNVVYRFKGNDVYKITLAQPGPFSATPMTKGVCYDKNDTEPLPTKDCKEAKSVLKLDGYSLNEAYEAVMEDYKAQIAEFMDSAADTAKEDLFVQKGEAKAVADWLDSAECEKLGPLSSYAKKTQADAKEKAKILRSTYSIETEDSRPDPKKNSSPNNKPSSNGSAKSNR